MEISKITAPNEWVYFAKGQANILFKYVGAHDYLKHKLLRIRLLKEEEEYISTCELYDFIELKCKPLFPKQIVDIQLVVLTTDFVTQLNNNGNKMMLKERYGLLIPNILYGSYQKNHLSKHCDLYIGHLDLPGRRNSAAAQDSSESEINSVIFEIKPKWLYDNTSANYCRTCLLGQVRKYQRHFCPLDFLYEDTLSKGLEDLFRPILQETMHNLEITNKIPIRELFEFFLNNPDNVFQRLKEYQKIDNKQDLIKNIGSASDVSQNLSLVMTLRDVGLFIKFEKFNRLNNIHTSNNNVNNVIEIEGYGKFLLTCNIYDLDLKSKMKYRHWCDVEERLQGVYNSVNPSWRFCTKRDVQNSLEK